MKGRPTTRRLGRRRSIVLLAAFMIACTSQAPPERAPNIILIIGDDHGYPYYGFTGSTLIQTPHLDKLALEGTTFTHGFTTASTCRLSLMSLLTGLHPDQWDAKNQLLQRRGKQRKEFDRIRDFTTLPELLGTRGYVSFQGGKYWEGSFEFGGFTHGMKKCWGPPRSAECVQDYVLSKKQKGVAKILARTDSLTLGRSTMQPLWDFLNDHSGEKPFFVWFAPMLPHKPYDPPERFLKIYRNRGLSRSAELYYANITRFDETVGELTEYLDRNGLRERTLVVYVSDNGWEQPPYEETGTWGGSRGKATSYELGYRTPIIVSWPGTIEQGRSTSALVSTVDLFATFLDYADLDLPEDRMGRSLRPVLSGANSERRLSVIGRGSTRADPALGAPDPQEPIYFLRDATWRYVWHVANDDDQLYRIEEDPQEDFNVAPQNVELARRFRTRIEHWLQEARDPYEESGQ